METDEIICALRTLRCADPCNCLSCPCEQFRSYDTGNACDDGTRLAAADRLKSQQARIAELEAQLAESQRREQAAVEDMKHSDNCDVCVGSGSEPDSCGCECMTCTLDCRCRDCRDESKFEWRGSQEAGEGEQA